MDGKEEMRLCMYPQVGLGGGHSEREADRMCFRHSIEQFSTLLSVSIRTLLYVYKYFLDYVNTILYNTIDTT